MKALFIQATRTAEFLLECSPHGQLECMDTALREGHARMLSGDGSYRIIWHGVEAQGETEGELVENWITMALRHTGEAA